MGAFRAQSVIFYLPTGAIGPLMKFSGKEHDAESELDYFGARYYDRGQYRFVSPDPVIGTEAHACSQRWNCYSFCANNPIVYVDPDGRSYLVFDGGRLTLYSANNELVGQWNASNNVASGNHYAFPNGTWQCNGAYRSSANQVASFGQYRYLGFTVYTDCYGEDVDMCVHSGGEDWTSRTWGCIRTTDEAMCFIMQYNTSDPVTCIIIVTDTG